MSILTRGRGGNHHPIPTKQFILDRLGQVGEDYISSLHQAYKDALDQLARTRALDVSIPKKRRRTTYYHHPTYYSFFKQLYDLINEGIVEFSGREEPSDDPKFSNWKSPPFRKFVRLVRR
jgi:hypothetical protein